MVARRIFAWCMVFVSAAFMLMSFHNCGPLNPAAFTDGSGSGKSTDGEIKRPVQVVGGGGGGGEGYDGKVAYTHKRPLNSPCPDGSLIESSILATIKGDRVQSARLDRTDCADIKPVELGANAYSVVRSFGSLFLVYQGVPFFEERRVGATSGTTRQSFANVGLYCKSIEKPGTFLMPLFEYDSSKVSIVLSVDFLSAAVDLNADGKWMALYASEQYRPHYFKGVSVQSVGSGFHLYSDKGTLRLYWPGKDDVIDVDCFEP